MEPSSPAKLRYCPVTVKVLRAANEAKSKLKARRTHELQVARTGTEVQHGVQLDGVLHVMAAPHVVSSLEWKTDCYLNLESAFEGVVDFADPAPPAFESLPSAPRSRAGSVAFTPAPPPGPPPKKAPPRGEGSTDVTETIGTSQRLIADAGQSQLRRQKQRMQPSDRKPHPLPVVARPPTPTSKRGGPPEEPVRRPRRRRGRDDKSTAAAMYDTMFYVPNGVTAKNVTRKLNHFVAASEKRIQQCKYRSAPAPHVLSHFPPLPGASPFRERVTLTPNHHDNAVKDRFTMQAVGERMDNEHRLGLATAPSKRMSVLGREDHDMPREARTGSIDDSPAPPDFFALTRVETDKEELKCSGALPVADMKKLASDICDMERASPRSADHSPHHTGPVADAEPGGRFALNYRRRAVALKVEKGSLPYCSFKRLLDESRHALNTRCLEELERCDERRRLFYSQKYEVLDTISDVRFDSTNKYNSWHPAYGEMQRILLSLATMKDSAERSQKRDMFLAKLRSLVEDQHADTPDCMVLVENLEAMLKKDNLVLSPSLFTQLLQQFDTPRLLQVGLYKVLDLIRPLFGLSDHTFMQMLKSLLRPLERSDMEVLLDQHLARISATASKSAKLRLRVHTVRHLDRDPTKCLLQVVISSIGASLELRTSVKQSPKPVWNEDFVLDLVDESKAVIEFRLYDFSNLYQDAIGLGSLRLGDDKLYKGVRRKVVVQLGKGKADREDKEELVVSIEALNFGDEPPRGLSTGRVPKEREWGRSRQQRPPSALSTSYELDDDPISGPFLPDTLF